MSHGQEPLTGCYWPGDRAVLVWTGGQHPRHFELSLSQDLLLVANKDGRNLVSFDVDATSGLLTMPSTLGVSFEPTQVLFPAP
jgi:6-phosphogluconolactonase (cycloisomerase 2 family)